MFKENKYTRWYYSIIEKAKNRDLKEEYSENHHVIPKCLGGIDNESNLAKLLAREHFICHLLLTKMHDDYRLKFALHMMAIINPKQKDKRISIKSHTYAYIKKCNSEASSIRSICKSKQNFGKVNCYNPETGINTFKFESEIPEGYIRGWSEDRKKSIVGKNIGRKYFYHPETNEVIAIFDNQEIPEGYIKGNPFASSNLGVIGKKISHCSITGKISKNFIIPKGYIEGDPYIWINNGIECRKLNTVIEKIPTGWLKGRLSAEKTATSRKNNGKKKVMTPWGIYSHPLRFAEEFKFAAPYIFADVDSKIQRIFKKYEYLNSKLKEIGYDFNKTKRENGFYFMKDNK
jgi:hypothetical protein